MKRWQLVEFWTLINEFVFIDNLDPVKGAYGAAKVLAKNAIFWLAVTIELRLGVCSWIWVLITILE